MRYKDFSCAAFPDGIPAPYLLGTEKHDHHAPGDNGIMYEPVAEEEFWERLKGWLKK